MILKLAKFMNYLMLDGKKGTAEHIFYNAMDYVKNRTKKDGKEIFQLAVKNASPSLEVKSRRIGGANYQVPIEVPRHRSFFLLHIGSLILQDQDLVSRCQYAFSNGVNSAAKQ